MRLLPVIIFLLVSIFLIFSQVDSQLRRNTEPINVGFIFSLPYDISNTLRAPLGGPLSLVLGAGLALIMFFGMLASPLYYLFGLPPRPYHIRDAEKNFTLDSDFFSRRSLEGFFQSEWKPAKIPSLPNFSESAFLLIPVENIQCQLLMICHAHGFLKWVPPDVLKFYTVFSQKIIGVRKMEEAAILTGLEDQGKCSRKYDQCPLDIVRIGKMTFNYIITQILH